MVMVLMLMMAVMVLDSKAVSDDCCQTLSITISIMPSYSFFFPKEGNENTHGRVTIHQP